MNNLRWTAWPNVPSDRKLACPRQLCGLGLLLVAVAAAAADGPARKGPLPAGTSMQCPPIEYPPAAIRAEATGTSRVRIVFDTAGQATQTDIERASGTTREHGILDRVAAATASRCTLTGYTGSTELSASVEFVWRLSPPGLPSSQQSLLLRQFLEAQQALRRTAANAVPSETTNAQLLLSIYAFDLQYETEQCMAARPQLAPELRQAAKLQEDRAQQALDAVTAAHPEALTARVPVSLLNYLKMRQESWRSFLKGNAGSALCDWVLRTLNKTTADEMQANMLLDLQSMQGSQGKQVTQGNQVKGNNDP